MYLIYLDGSYLGCMQGDSEKEIKDYLFNRYIKIVKSDSTLSRFNDADNYDGYEWSISKKYNPKDFRK